MTINKLKRLSKEIARLHEETTIINTLIQSDQMFNDLDGPRHELEINIRLIKFVARTKILAIIFSINTILCKQAKNLTQMSGAISRLTLAVDNNHKKEVMDILEPEIREIFQSWHKIVETTIANLQKRAKPVK